MNKKIGYSDLSGALKTLVVLTWIVIGMYLFAFLVGFVGGMLVYI